MKKKNSDALKHAIKASHTEYTSVLRLIGEIMQTILTTKQIIYLPVYASLYSAHRTSHNTKKKENYSVRPCNCENYFEIHYDWNIICKKTYRPTHIYLPWRVPGIAKRAFQNKLFFFCFIYIVSCHIYKEQMSNKAKTDNKKKKKNNHKQSQGLEAENDQDFIH